jgi:hypothetical protein
MACYICGDTATSSEHAPAKGFFPKDQRYQLITVPSCSIHNQATSKDDEYARNVIAMLIGNNGHALTHFLKTCLSSLKASPGLLKRTTRVNRRVFVGQKNEEKLQPTYALQIERDRIDLVLTKIAYAIFYHEFGYPWERELIIATEYFVDKNMQQDALGQIIKESKSDPEYTEPNYKGSNPTIFKYSFIEMEENNVFDQALIMKFYEGFEAWIYPKEGSSVAVLLSNNMIV